MRIPEFTAEASLGARMRGHSATCLEAVGAATTDNLVEPQSGGLPVHGNWCGPGHGGGPATDAVDAVCRTHDQCYGRSGYFDCRCDRDLIRSMPGAIAATPSAGGKVAGAAAMAWFANSYCICRKRVCYPVVRWCRGWLNIPYPCGTRTSCSTIPVPSRGGAC